MHLGGNLEVLIDALIPELDLKKFAVGIVANGGQRSGFNGGRFHGWDSILDNCGFRLRFRSPGAAAISFHRAIVVASPTVGAIASITR